MTSSSPRRRLVPAAALAAVLLVLLLSAGLVAGCKPLVVRAELAGPVEVKASLQTVRYEGTFVSEQLFTKIDGGQTTRAYLVALLGPPDETTDLGGGRELLIYRYRPSEQSASLVSLLGASGELDPRFVTTAFEVVDGRVVEKIRG